MNTILNFLLQVQRLKIIRRTGWTIRGVKNPERISDHAFRVTLLAWLLADKKGLDVKRCITIALFHDFGDVYAGDITPYDHLLKGKKDSEKREILKKWVRFSKKERKEVRENKFKKEKQSLLRLLRNLAPRLKREIFSSWMSFEHVVSREGKFVKQIDRIEALIQSIEYFGAHGGGSSWWERAEERVDNELLIRFVKTVQKKFYKAPVKTIKEAKELRGILDFILKTEVLKSMPRQGWVLRGVEQPETIASHSFTVMVLTWALYKLHATPHLDELKLLKMALVHEICEVYALDETPYDRLLKNKTGSAKKDVFKKWIRLSKKEKSEMFLKDYAKERKALSRLTKGLREDLQKEIIGLWEEFKTSSTLEGHFLGQIEVLATLLQACLYWQKDRRFPIEGFWEWAFEISDTQMNFEFMEALKKKFAKKKFLFSDIFEKLNFFEFLKNN